MKFAAFIAAGLVLFTGCDAFRSLVGRPTSRDIAGKTLELERLGRQKDSTIAALRTELALRDSLAREAGLASSMPKASFNGSFVNFCYPDGKTLNVRVRKFPRGSAPLPEGRYCIAVGTFTDKGNLEKMLRKVSRKGETPFVVELPGNRSSVVLNPSDEILKVAADFRKVIEDSSYPSDSFIFDSK